MRKEFQMERKFFKINQMFFMVITSLSLLGAVGCLIYGLSLRNATANDTITQPTPTYEQLKRDKAAEKAENERSKTQRDAQAAQPGERMPQANPEAIPAEHLDVLNSIEKSLVSFSQKSNQISPPDKIRFRIFKRADGYSKYLSAAGLLRQLNAEAKALEADAERIKSMPSTDPEYITWALFLDHFFTQAEENILEQRRNIEEENAKAERKRLMSNWVLYGAAAAFNIFILFTMFLVILSMERNTYMLRQIQEGLNKNISA